MSATTSDATGVSLPRGLGRQVTTLVVRVFAPGVVATLLLQHAVMLPAVLAPVASVLGLQVR